MKLKFFPLYLSMIIPLDLTAWKEIKFDKIKANKVEVVEDSLNIKIENSSSILIYPLQEAKELNKIKISGKLIGNLNFTKNQGNENFDDFTLKIGFIVSGDKKLSGLKKLFAPKWIKDLHLLIPKETGLSHLELFVAVKDKKLLNTNRLHPLSDLFHENFIFDLSKEGNFNFESKTKSKFKVVGLWMSSDGDNSKSQYSIQINSLEIE